MPRLTRLVPTPLIPMLEFFYTRYRGLSDGKYQRQPDDPAILPPAKLRYQIGAIEIPAFIASGKRGANDMDNALAKLGRPMSAFTSILDFGCGVGRTIVWVQKKAPAAKLFGSDLNAEGIEWCRQNLKFAEFAVNKPVPPTAYADQSFDLVYAISVFTHLNEEHQFSWLEELKRIIKPGGIALISVHGEFCWQQLDAEEIAIVKEKGISARPSRSRTAMFPKTYTNTHHTKEYIERTWAKYFQVVDFIPKGMNDHQDLVVLKR